jgi:hypothetical protein
MTKTPSSLTFAPEPAQPLGVIANFRRQNLDGYPVTQQNMPGAVDGSHTSLAQHCIDLILPVEDRTDERGEIFLQHLAIDGTKTDAIVVLSFANAAMFHRGVNLNVATGSV